MAFPQLYSLKEEVDGEGKVANSFPFSDYKDGNYYGMVKLKKEKENISRTNGNFLKASQIELSLQDVIRRIVGENPQVGTISIDTFSNERDDEGHQVYESVGLSLELLSSHESPKIIDDEIVSGYYQGETISYYSEIKIGFQISVNIDWVGESYSGDYIYNLINLETGQTIQTKSGSGTINSFIFDAMPAYNDNQELINYKTEQILSDSNWSSTIAIDTINYESEIKEVDITNNYETPVGPDLPGMILYVDATIPPSSGTWKNQIENQSDMLIRDSNYSISDDEVIFNPGQTRAVFPISSTLSTYTFYIIAKSIGVNTFNNNQSGFEDSWLRIGPLNGWASAGTFNFGSNFKQPSFNQTGNSDKNYQYDFLCEGNRYHIYAFSRYNNKIKIYEDGVYKKEISAISITGNETAIILNASADGTAEWNRNTNYYKMFAYANVQHTNEQIIEYSNYLISKYNIDTSSSYEFLEKVSFNNNCIIDTNYTLNSDDIYMQLTFKPTDTGYSTYVNNSAPVIYTDTRNISEITSTGTSTAINFSFKYTELAEISTLNDSSAITFNTGSLDQLLIIGQSYADIRLRDRYNTSFYRREYMNNVTPNLPKDSSVKFLGKNSSGFYGDLHRIILSQNSNIKRSFIPAKDLVNNVYGVYDLVNSQFYSSTGSNQFSQ